MLVKTNHKHYPKELLIKEKLEVGQWKSVDKRLEVSRTRVRLENAGLSGIFRGQNRSGVRQKSAGPAGDFKKKTFFHCFF